MLMRSLDNNPNVLTILLVNFFLLNAIDILDSVTSGKLEMASMQLILTQLSNGQAA